MTFTIKALTSLAAIGTVSGLGVGIAYWHSYSIDLKRDLLNKSFTPLVKNNQEDQTIWTNLAKKYATENPSEKLRNLTLTLKTNKELNDGDLVKFQDACESLFAKKTNEKNYSELFKLAKNWCIKEANQVISGPSSPAA